MWHDNAELSGSKRLPSMDIKFTALDYLDPETQTAEQEYTIDVLDGFVRL